MSVVPLPSERCTTTIGWSGSLTPGFAAVMRGSFHFVILPRKMSASTSGVKLQLRVARAGCRSRTTAPSTVGMWSSCAGRLLELLVGHGPVGGAEVDGPLGDLPDAAARADRLVVEPDARDRPWCTRRTTSSRSDTGTWRRRRSSASGPPPARRAPRSPTPRPSSSAISSSSVLPQSVVSMGFRVTCR